MKLLLLLVFATISSCSGDYTNVVTGIFSKTTSNDVLRLPSTSSYLPIQALTTTVMISRPASVFVSYQITINSSSTFQTKLQIDNFDVGSIVLTHVVPFKTMTGYWMGHLGPGEYTFRVLHAGSAVYVPKGVQWQTAKLQVMWFELDTTDVLSDNVKCYPTPITSNNYDNWGPVTNLGIIIQLPSNRALLSAYQFSTYYRYSSQYKVHTSLDINGFQQPSTSFIATTTARYRYYLDLHGIWAGEYNDGIHYFNVLYRSTIGFEFIDCHVKHRDNKNLYVMMLPPTCKVVQVNPRTHFGIKNTTWVTTDVCYNLTLEKTCHIIAMYHFTSEGSDQQYVFNRLTRNSVPMEHTTSISGNTLYTGNTGVWVGALDQGGHNICIQYARSGKGVAFTDDKPYHTRSLTITYCC